MATEFSLESVRQYMLAHEGRVTNHDLVKHYKAWLTHPTEKESARQRFKGRKISKAIYFALQTFQKQTNSALMFLIAHWFGRVEFRKFVFFFQLCIPVENNNKYSKFAKSKSMSYPRTAKGSRIYQIKKRDFLPVDSS